MQEFHAWVASSSDQFAVYLVRHQFADAFAPCFNRFAHRYPYVSVQVVHAFNGFFGVVGYQDACAAFFGKFSAHFLQFFGGLQFFWCGNAHVHAQFGTNQQQRVAHVVARIAQVSVADLAQWFVAVFLHGQNVSQHLSGVPFVGQAVEYRHACIFRQLFNDGLFETAVFNRVIHAAQHAGGVFHAFFMTDLRRSGVNVSYLRALVVSGHFKRATSAGRSFFKNQGNVFAFQGLLFCASVFSAFQIARQIQQEADFLFGVVNQAQQMTVVQIE